MKKAAFRLLPAVVCLFAFFTFSFLAAPAPPVVDEAAMQAELKRDALLIIVPVKHAANLTAATFTIELIDSDNEKLAEVSQSVTLRRGENLLQLRIVWRELLDEKNWQERLQMLTWTRVHYRLQTVETRYNQAQEVAGIRALGWMLKDLFTLRIIAPTEPSQGTPAHIRVFAENPLTHQPVAGVNVEAALALKSYDEKTKKAETRQGMTSANGSVAFDLLPPVTDEHEEQIECSLKIVATRPGFRIEEERELDFYDRAAAIITTDKPLYQPGQILHIRTLVFDGLSRRPRKSENLTVEIEDGEYKNVFERELVTDRFGVATADWTIPATAPLGQYQVEIHNQDNQLAEASVRISRYELPTFVVNVEPDKPFYLPDEDARVKVSAAFVYGEPVKAGRVRVAREEEREWNWRAQKWEVEESAVWEGEAEKDGAFTAQIALTDEHQKLKESDYSKYRDINYVARYTEAASGRSEERRFRLRVTKDAIHLYVFSTDIRQPTALPLRFYAVANYADGTPATVDMALKAQYKHRSDEKGLPPLFTIHTRTDKHGIALIEPDARLQEAEDLQLELSARDAKGATGAISEELPISGGDALRIKTPRALYHRGEPLQVEIQSTRESIPRLLVELFADNRLLRVEEVAVREGHANLEFDATADLRGRVTIVAYDPQEASDYRWDARRFATRSVLYPTRRTLSLNARFERDSVKPGEATRLSFTANAPDGRGRETSLGVVVYDTAVEERERTECESGQGRNYFGAYYSRFFNWHEAVSDVTLGDLEQLDEARPFPADLELIADALLQRTGNGYRYRSYSARAEGESVEAEFDDAIEPLKITINWILGKPSLAALPRDRESLQRLLARHGIELDRLADFWGNLYRVQFAVRDKNYTVDILSNGPDEQPGTNDDFRLVEYSRAFWDTTYNNELIRAIDGFKSRKGRYPNRVAEILEELRFYGASFLSAKDPWGEAYKIIYTPSRSRSVYELRVMSTGKNRKFDKDRYDDDLTLFQLERDWFADKREAIRRVLTTRFINKQAFPENASQFEAYLNDSGIPVQDLRDPWGYPLQININETARYGVRPQVTRVAATVNAPAVDKTTLEPITQTIRRIWLSVSVKPGLATWFTGVNEPINFSVATYDQIVREESREDALQQANESKNSNQTSTNRRKVLPAGLGGAISGIVVDMSGAVIPGATVTLTNQATNVVLQTKTDDNGYYGFSSLSPGKYSLKVESQGFKSSEFLSIDVRLSATTIVDVELNVGGVSETVMVAAEPTSLQTESTQVSASQTRDQKTASLPQRANPATTPRLRQDFPETLVWQPTLVTDAQGHAELKFKVADSITTWRMAVIGSTEDGLIGTTTADLRAFQPFFVEHQPPPSLTIGDEIEVPVVARNFQKRAASVNVKLAPAAWMQLFADAEQTLRAAANDSATARIQFKAIKAGEFKQEASAIGDDDGDRVARPVAVRFDGRDNWQTAADLFQRQTTMEVQVPGRTINGSSRVELKIYPDLFAHAVEGIEGILQRPHGCAEQTTSSTYPNLIVLQYLQRTGRKLPAIEQKALRYLGEGIARLRSFVTPGGGYAYFNGSSPDVPLTAYIARFLSEAGEFAAVDEAALDGARRYLAHEQRVDGGWSAYGYAGSNESSARVSATVVCSLVFSQAQSAADSKPTENDPQKAIVRGLDFLARATREGDDAYALALYVLAALKAGRVEAASESANTLLKLANASSGALHWGVDYTPYYGWGRAGKIETTGLAVEALMTLSQQPNVKEREAFAQAARRGLLFIVQSKDEYGIWYSTQATINALRAIIAVASQDDTVKLSTLKFEIQVDDGASQIVEVKVDAGEPALVDLTARFPQIFDIAGTHRVSLRTEASRTLSAAVVTRSTLRWDDKDARGISDDGALRLRVGFDKTEIKQGETVTCTVHAERVASGYGMMLLEVGLPPGVDVDVESLRRASVSRFDVTPDRVVIYLWSKPGGIDFSFTFRPRLKINAKAQPSLLYDYYNPDARVSVPPAQFVVNR
ncbi:MAG: carboxypeptidase regulatory-like domain-containing protein [Acidobacteriota bacterium]